jgi:hypothetical protein
MEEKFIISKDIKEATKNCSKDFSCLRKNETTLCKVVFCVNCKLHGVLCESDEPCNYRYNAEERTFCTCPVRKEIYSKYNV